MAELPILPVKTDALLADTTHMSAEEFGVYCRLLFVMWRHEARLKDDDEELAIIAGVPLKRWRAIKEKVMRPMTVGGGQVSQKRLTDTWINVQEKRRKNAMSGAQGGNRRWESSSSDGDSRKLRSRRMTEAREKGRHSKEEWASLLEICGNVCVKCGRPDVVKDHITPIYAGGSDAIDNLQPLCVPCNGGKGPDSTDYRPDGWRDALRMPSERLVKWHSPSSEMPYIKTKTKNITSIAELTQSAEPSMQTGVSLATAHLEGALRSTPDAEQVSKRPSELSSAELKEAIARRRAIQ